MLPNTWVTFTTKFAAKNFQKSPNLVTLGAEERERESQDEGTKIEPFDRKVLVHVTANQYIWFFDYPAACLGFACFKTQTIFGYFALPSPTLFLSFHHKHQEKKGLDQSYISQLSCKNFISIKNHQENLSMIFFIFLRQMKPVEKHLD